MQIVESSPPELMEYGSAGYGIDIFVGTKLRLSKGEAKLSV
jgi:hypothetical protein